MSIYDGKASQAVANEAVALATWLEGAANTAGECPLGENMHRAAEFIREAYTAIEGQPIRESFVQVTGGRSPALDAIDTVMVVLNRLNTKDRSAVLAFILTQFEAPALGGRAA